MRLSWCSVLSSRWKPSVRKSFVPRRSASLTIRPSCLPRVTPLTISLIWPRICVTETIALYIQKYVQYRKRKVFFGESGRVDDLIPAMVKHKNEKYLVPMSDVHNDSISNLLESKKLNHRECVMYKTVSNDFTTEEVKTFDYDMLIFFSPSGIESLTKNFPDFKQGEIAIATFGPATAKAAKDAGLRLDIEAPSEKYPSMTGALLHYLLEKQG